jgi:hypothetical protein
MIATPTFTPVDFTERKYYTIHSSANNAFTLQVSEKTKMAMVGFHSTSDAHFIGNMIETHYREKKEWPDVREVGTLILPTGRLSDLSLVFIKEWEFEDLKFECTRNIMDMISVEEILKKNASYSFKGNLYTFTAPPEFYMSRFEELLDII